MTQAITLGLMALAAALFIAAPLLARRAPPRPRATFDRAVFRDQLAEVERDLERGVIGADDAAAARTEIGRRLLQAEDAAASETPGRVEAGGTAPPGPTALARVVIVLLMALVPAAGGGLYLLLGRPGLPDLPAARRAAEAAPLKSLSDAQIAATVALIEKRLESRPDEIQGWIILSTAYLRLGREAAAERALERALALAADDRERAARIALDFGEALVGINGGRIVPRAEAAFERARRLAPGNPSVRYYLGLARLQAGDARGALTIWRRLLADLSADAPFRQTLRNWVERIAEEENIDLRGLDGPIPPGNP